MTVIVNGTPVPDETIVCRCEDVALGDIRRAVRDGCDSPAALRKATRTGMGMCQGRTCQPVIRDILSLYCARPPGKIPPISVRPPVKAVSLASLIPE
ncbi:MAG: (2Fe-2S)-binding protein [Deltaproteobacteria bacterium]|nr:(2Fe-2S)-binding protein [Deltaproteobacteria bacterium]